MNHRADQLTPQEDQVVLALLSGSTNREVAAQLYVSVKTIELTSPGSIASWDSARGARS